MGMVLALLRLVLAAVFATSAAGKLLDRERWRRTPAENGVGARLIGLAAVTAGAEPDV